VEMILALLLAIFLRPPAVIEAPVVLQADLKPEFDRLGATADRLVFLAEAVFVSSVFTAGLAVAAFLTCGNRGPKDDGRPRGGGVAGERSDRAVPGEAGGVAPARPGGEPRRTDDDRGVDLPPIPPLP